VNSSEPINYIYFPAILKCVLKFIMDTGLCEINSIYNKSYMQTRHKTAPIVTRWKNVQLDRHSNPGPSEYNTVPRPIVLFGYSHIFSPKRWTVRNHDIILLIKYKYYKKNLTKVLLSMNELNLMQIKLIEILFKGGDLLLSCNISRILRY
jgi:hypothetical protein